MNFSILDDSNPAIANLYGINHLEQNNNRDVRVVFIIDPNNMIRAEFFYLQEAGRNINELPRTVKDLIQDRAGQSDVLY